MRSKFKILLISATLALISCGLRKVPLVRGGPHEGYDISVWIDGTQSSPKDSAVFLDKDYFSQVGGDRLWEVDSSISSQPKFEYRVDREIIGDVTSARAMLESPSKDGKGIWDPIYFNLSDPSDEFQPGWVVESENFEYADGKKAPDGLPSGTYLVRFFVYGTKSWDTQNIFVRVE